VESAQKSGHGTRKLVGDRGSGCCDEEAPDVLPILGGMLERCMVAQLGMGRNYEPSDFNHNSVWAMLDPRVVQHQAQWTWVNLYLAATGTVAVAWIILLARLLIWAPYDTVKKIEAKNKADLGVIKERFDQFHSALDDKLAKAEAQHNIADRIVMGREVLKLLDRPDEFLKAADEWNQDTELFLANNLGGYASVYFSIPHSLGPVDLSDYVKAGRQLILAKIIALDDIAAHIDTYYRPIGVKFDKLQDNKEKPTPPLSTPDKEAPPQLSA
jgi:hypothetical protein